MKRLFYRNGWYYARFLNAVFQIPSVHDLYIQDGPQGWERFRMEKLLGISTVIKMP